MHLELYRKEVRFIRKFKTLIHSGSIEVDRNCSRKTLKISISGKNLRWAFSKAENEKNLFLWLRQREKSQWLQSVQQN